MTMPSAGEKAVSALEIDDVFLLRCDNFLDRLFNQTAPMPAINCINRLEIDQSVVWQTRQPLDKNSNQIHILRYLVIGEVFFLRESQPEEETEPRESNILAKISHTFAVDYVSPAAFLDDKDAIASFGKNAAFHAWPYWREAVHQCTARMRLPRVTIPMFKPTMQASVQHVEPRKM